MSSPPRWKRYFHELIAAEISAFTRYYDRVIQYGRAPGDAGHVFDAVAVAPGGSKTLIENDHELPDLSGETASRTAIVLNGTINHDQDIQNLLQRLRPKLSRSSRIVVVAFNTYLSWLYWIALRLRLKSGVMPTTFLTWTDLDNLCRLAGFERVRSRPAVYVPWKILGLGSLVNWILPAIPILRRLAFTEIVVLRPIPAPQSSRPPVSVIVPARNERGNIAAVLERMPDLGAPVEIIFVEGHSSDGTWEEIQRVSGQPSARFTVVACRQPGIGKADAVRQGFSIATGDLLTILDADLTMPPDLLPRFIDAWVEGRADFINGSRSVYAMEGEAMRFLNRLGNVFFAKTLSWILGVRLGDVLCGTKVVSRSDYRRMQAWRKDFGDFDPFGDFELLFPAAVLGIGIIDVPIRYRARTYGSTNIRRFRHGLMLFWMLLVGFFRLKLAQLP